MPRAEWRSPAAYENLRSLDAPGFAWEFLSRNPAFDRDCKRFEKASEDGPLSTDELNGFARRWGVRFRKACACWRRLSAVVDGGAPAERHRPDPALARSHGPEPGRCCPISRPHHCQRGAGAPDRARREVVPFAHRRDPGRAEGLRRPTARPVIRRPRQLGASPLAHFDGARSRPQSSNPVTGEARPAPFRLACARRSSR